MEADQHSATGKSTHMFARRWRWWAVIVLCGGATALGLLLFWPQESSAVPDLAHLNASAEQGRYLAIVSNCRTCHTAQGGKPFAGGMRFQTPFGLLHSTNITPDTRTGIGNWSFADFYHAMKDGLRADGSHLYPAFPYTSFARMTDADIGSLYLFVKTLDPVHQEPTPNRLSFPYNIRSALRLWNALFHDSRTYAANPARSPEWNRGAYLVEGPGHCGACHTPRNSLGAERRDLALTGGLLLAEVRPGKIREWSATNLTGAKIGLGKWEVESIARYLKRGECERAVVHGPMTEVVMNSTRYLSVADAHAIATYLKMLAPRSEDPGKPPQLSQLKSGEVAYTVHCGTCHLPTGVGDEVLGVSLSGNAIVQAHDPASLINVILYGPHLPPPPFVVDRTRMKDFGKRLSDQEIADLATFVRASFGNRAGAVTADQVRLQR